jgi:hypothetical protein
MNFRPHRASNPSVRVLLAWLVPSLVTLAGLITAPSVDAQAPTEASEARLGILTTRDRQLLEPHLERGPVALVEFSVESDLPAIIMATYIRAPAEQVVEVIRDPSGYPRFMPALDSVEILSRHERSIAYRWTWTTGVFTLTGTNAMTLYPGPQHRRDRPWRVESRAVGGDLGTGRLMWRVYPMGPSKSLLVLSSRLDLRDANYVTRSMGDGRRSINRTLNLSLATVMVLGTRRESERRAGVSATTPGPVPALSRPDIDSAALAAMMFRGDILFFQMTGDRLDQISVVGRPGTTAERLREVMTDPNEFGPALVPGSYANVLEDRGAQVDFEWGVNIPLVGTSGTMRLDRREPTVAIDAIDGALEGGRWRFATEALPWGEPVVLGWARFDLASAGWLLRAVVGGSRDFGIGLTAGTELMVMRAIRSRAWRLHEQRAAASESHD